MNYTYDPFGRIEIEAENFGQFVTTTTKYLASHATEVTDSDLNITTTYKDGFGDVIRIEQPEDTTTYINRNEWGQIYEVRQSGFHNGYTLDQVQTYEYDSQQRLCHYNTPSGNSQLYAYNAAGELTHESSGHENISGCVAPSGTYLATHSYDDLGRLRYTDFAQYGTPNIGRKYDKNSNLTALYQEHNNTDDIPWYDDHKRVAWEYEYGSINNLTLEKLWLDNRNFKQVHTYLPDGSLESSSRKYQHDNHVAADYAYTHDIDYTRDGLGRGLSLSLDGGGGFTGDLASGASYHASGALTALNYGNGQSFSHIPNPRLLPGSMTTTGSAGTALDLSYIYNSRGLVTGMTDGVNADNTRTYGYDGQGRLTSATGPWGVNGASASGSFTYDSLGNLRSKQLGARSVALSYDDTKNQLSAANDSLAAASGGTGNRDVTYDSRGNIRHLGGQGFLYNAMNRPTSIAGDVDAVYRYDGHGRRVRSLVYKDTGYILRYNVYGASGDLIFNVQIDQSPANEDYVSTYVKMDGKTLARVKSVGQAFNYTDTVTYLHNDHLGSASSGTLADGSIAWREDYSPFGITLQNDASNDNQPGFTGHLKDSATGLNYMQARYYDPVIGRFLSVDPVTFTSSGGNPGYFNRYAYTMNDPINMIDPDGRSRLRAMKYASLKKAETAARRYAVRRAWREETQLVRQTGEGTREWTAAQKKELLKNRKVSGFKGHHRNTVNGNSLESAADPNNVQFLTKAQHDKIHKAAGGTRAAISGKKPLNRSHGGTLKPLPGRLDPDAWKSMSFSVAAGVLGRLDAVDPLNVFLVTTEIGLDGSSLSPPEPPGPI